MSDILVANNLTKIYQRGIEDVYALQEASLTIKKGEICTIVGPSGSGKTTLVNILGCLDNPTSGELILNGKTIFQNKNKLAENKLTTLRRQYFGYVFQKFFLIPTLTVFENTIVPLAFHKNNITTNNVNEVLEMLGLDKRKNHLPSELSGGEMQRVAIARALVNKPSILLADEPTGNLDSKRCEELKKLFLELNKNSGITIVIVTHDLRLAEAGQRIIELCDGKIINNK